MTRRSDFPQTLSVGPISAIGKAELIAEGLALGVGFHHLAPITDDDLRLLKREATARLDARWPRPDGNLIPYDLDIRCGAPATDDGSSDTPVKAKRKYARRVPLDLTVHHVADLDASVVNNLTESEAAA